MNQRQIRQRICQRMEWSEERFANHLIDSMADFTTHWCGGDKELESMLMNSGMYVKWYVSNYYKRCKVLLNTLPKGRQGFGMKKRFESLHSPENISNYPNRVVIQEVIKEHKHKSFAL